MPGPPVAYFAKRARRRIVSDLRDDLEDFENSDILGLLRGHVCAQLKKNAEREAGLPPHARRPTFNLPDLPRSTRRSNAKGEHSFHLGFAKPNHARSASADDAYASGKDEREREQQRGREEAIGTGSTKERNLNGGLELVPDGGDTAAARSHDGYTVKDSAKVSVVITNLDKNAAARSAQWDDIEEHERKALTKARTKGTDRINIDVARSPELAKAVMGEPDCPAALRERIADALNGEKPRRSGVAWISDDATRVHTWIRTLPAFVEASDSERKALKYSGGRAVADHDFIELELPASLQSAGRGRVIQRTVDFIADLPGRSDSHDPEYRVPVTGVGHNPDALNDGRNCHFHVLNARRRFRIDDGTLSRDEGGNLIAEAHRVPAICAKDWKKTLRKAYADIVNDELAAAGLDERLHPGRYADMCIDATSMTKLHNAQTVLNRAGVRTVPAYDNVTEAYRREFSDIDASHVGDIAAADRHRRDDDERIRGGVPDLVLAARLREQVAQATTLYNDAAGYVRDAAYIETYVAMARSSTEAPIAFAGHYAEEAAKAGRSNYDVQGWRQRAAAAQTFRDDQHKELAEERAAIAERRKSAETLRQRAAAIDADVAAAIEIAKARSAVATTIVHPISETTPLLTPTAPGDDVTVTGSRGAPRVSLHAVIDAIAKTPLRLSCKDQRYFVAPEDDDAKIGAATLRFDNESGIRRLARIHETQQRELAAIKGHIEKHGDVVSAVDYVAAQQARWSRQPAYARMLAEAATRSAARPKPTAVAVDETNNSTLPVGAPSLSAPAAPPPRPTHPAEERRRAVIQQQYNIALEMFVGSPRLNHASAWLLDANLRNPYSPRADGNEGRRLDAERFALFLQHPPFAERASKMADGDPTTIAEVKQLLGTDPAVEPWRDTGWVRVSGTAIDFTPHRKTTTSARFENLIATDLRRIEKRPPPLTREANGQVGVLDQELLAQTHYNHLGLRLASSQAVLVGLHLAQEIRREQRAAAVENATASSAPINAHSLPLGSDVNNVTVEVWRRAVAQKEDAAVLTWTSNQLVGEAEDRKGREARLAQLTDDEKRKLLQQVSLQKRPYISVADVRPAPGRKSRKKAKRAPGISPGSIAD